MLEKSTAVSTFSVRDIAESKKFYVDVLGLSVREEYEGRILRVHLAGDTEVMIYGKEGHEPASFTVLTFTVDDIRAVIDGLKARGVEFDRPEGLELDEEIHHAPGHDAAWFRDPSGNTFSVNQEVAD